MGYPPVNRAKKGVENPPWKYIYIHHVPNGKPWVFHIFIMYIHIYMYNIFKYIYIFTYYSSLPQSINTWWSKPKKCVTPARMKKLPGLSHQNDDVNKEKWLGEIHIDPELPTFGTSLGWLWYVDLMKHGWKLFQYQGCPRLLVDTVPWSKIRLVKLQSHIRVRSIPCLFRSTQISWDNFT